MHTQLHLHEGIIRHSLVAELEAFRPREGRVSSYYLDLDLRHWGSEKAARIALKNALSEEKERIRKLDLSHAVRQSLLRDCDMVEEVAPTAIAERYTLALACFVASEANYGRALRLPWPVRQRLFQEDRFVLWPLRLILDQSDRYGIVLTNKDLGRLFLYFQERIEEVRDMMDEVPGRVRFPDPFGESHYMRRHVEHFHHHFEKVSEAALRLLEREPFAHLIVGGLWETLPQFEGRLHRYLGDRIVARWDIDVNTPTAQILERARQEEREFLRRQAQEIWKSIQDQRPKRGALGPEEVFAALWQRRVQALLLEPEVVRKGFRCTVCGRLNLNVGPCVECGGKTAEVPDAYEEAVHEAIEQSAHVRYWLGPALHAAGSIAAFLRY